MDARGAAPRQEGRNGLIGGSRTHSRGETGSSQARKSLDQVAMPLRAKGTSRDVRRCRRGTMRFRLAAPGAESPDSASRAAAPLSLPGD